MISQHKKGAAKVSKCTEAGLETRMRRRDKRVGTHKTTYFLPWSFRTGLCSSVYGALPQSTQANGPGSIKSSPLAIGKGLG